MPVLDLQFLTIVLIATVAAMAFSAFWYSPRIFGNAWMRLAGIPATHAQDGRKMMVFTFFAYIALAMTLFMILTWAGAVTWRAGLLVGFWVGCGVSCMSVLVPYLWEGRALRLFLITAGNIVLAVTLMSTLMAHLSGAFFGAP